MLAAGCGSAPGAAGSGTTPTASIPDCATPVQVQNVPVFALGVSALGKVCWETPLTNPGRDFHSWSPPILAGGSAVLDSDGDVFSVDLAHGKVTWDWKSASPPVVTSGGGGGNFTIATDDGVVVASKDTPQHTYLVGLDESTGAIRWQRLAPNYGASSGGAGSTIFVFNQGQQVEVEAWADRTGATLWSTVIGRQGGSSYGTSGDGLVFGYVDGVEALSAGTGRLQWDAGPSQALVAFPGLLVAPPYPVPGKTVEPAVALDPATGATLWSTPPLNQNEWDFLNAGGDLMQLGVGMPSGVSFSQKTGGFLARIDLATGHNLWSVPTYPNAVVGTANVIADVEGKTGYDSGPFYLVGRSAATGAVLWRAPITTPYPWGARLTTFQGPSGSEVLLESGYQGNQLIAYDAQTGTQSWELQLPKANFDAVSAAPGGVIVQACEVNCIQGSH